MTPDSPAAVRVENDGYWEHYLAAENPPYEIRGKYLFFSEDRARLVRIAIQELTNGGFHLAKTHLPGRNLNAEYVLCLYYSDDSRKHELAAKYKTQPWALSATFTQLISKAERQDAMAAPRLSRT